MAVGGRPEDPPPTKDHDGLPPRAAEQDGTGVRKSIGLPSSGHCSSGSADRVF